MRTITAACTLSPPDDLIAQTCAFTSSVSSRELAQRHVLVLEVIGFVLP
ncbi:hypothetical protein OG426_52960 [Streptomyces canus]|nr:hypothetical protein [Streptomyces canus]MCX4854021.1 hypothetical protein [Streptomyces canus]WSW40517.1 hypothetical protein OG426_52960 [Streptomyces canus]